MKEHNVDQDPGATLFGVIMAYADDNRLENIGVLRACSLVSGFVLGVSYHHDDHCDCGRQARDQYVEDVNRAMESAVAFKTIKAERAKQPHVH